MGLFDYEYGGENKSIVGLLGDLIKGAKNNPRNAETMDSLFGGLGIVPGVGDVASGAEAAYRYKQGDMLGAGLAGLGALPLIPPISAGLLGSIKAIGNMPKKGIYPNGITNDMVIPGTHEEMFGESMAATIRKMNNGDYLGRYIPAWGGEGKPFYAIGDNLQELKNVMLTRMGKSELGTRSAKDAKFNNSLIGRLQNEFGDTFKTGHSTQSNSKYFTHEPSGLKVRVSDHDLPLGYEQPDIDLRTTMTLDEQIEAIKKAIYGDRK